jgi:hypothetical protein
MLNKDEAEMAIQYFYKDFNTLQVGNPLPFVMAYDKDTQIQFNELCFDSELLHVFYGNVTYSMDSIDSLATVARVAISASKSFDGTLVIPFMDIHKYFDATAPLANSVQGTTKGIFATAIVLAENVRVAFDGYLFKVSKKP